MRDYSSMLKANYFNKHRTIAMLAFILITGTLLASGTASSVQNQKTNLVITDMRGRQVSIPGGGAQRIVALEACSLRLVCYLGAADKVIAVEDSGNGREKTVHDFFYLATYRIAFPELRNPPSIGNSANYEAIIAAKPDLIICSTVDVAKLEQLQNALGIPVFAVDADVELDNISRFNEQLLKLGTVLGKDARAKELVDGISWYLSDIAQRKQKVQTRKRAYAGGMMYYGPADLLRTTGNYMPFDFTGITNVMPTNPAGNGQPYMTSLEALIAANPDYIFIDSANEQLSRKGYNDKKELLDSNTLAFKNKNVFTTLVYKYYGTNWENQLINVYYAAKTVYPELYTDINIEAKATEIWTLFFGRKLSYTKVLEYQKPGIGRASWW